MSNREKVIKGLECCITDGTDCPNDCPYTGDCNRKQLHTDALALLKAQEPRVMTLEEVKAKPDYAWIEKLDSKKTYIVLFDFTAVLSDLSSYAHTWNHYGKDELLLLLLYNKTWRCWTSRPNEKTMETTPWNAQGQRDYEAAVEMAEYCERYEPTYNADDGSM